jgi:hypothetical protein
MIRLIKKCEKHGTESIIEIEGETVRARFTDIRARVNIGFDFPDATGIRTEILEYQSSQIDSLIREAQADGYRLEVCLGRLDLKNTLQIVCSESIENISLPLSECQMIRFVDSCASCGSKFTIELDLSGGTIKARKLDSW